MLTGQRRAALCVLIGVAVACSDDIPSAPTEGEEQPAATLVFSGKYVITDLGAPPGCVNSRASGINEAGDMIVGDTCGEAALWQADGTLVLLGTLPGHASSAAQAVSDSGQIVGWSINQALNREAFLYTPGAGMVSIHDPALLVTSEAYAISNGGIVVGGGKTAGGIWRAFRWTQTGGMHLLEGDGRFAEDINDRGVIVGRDAGAHRGVIWHRGGVTLVGTLGGSSSVASGINDAGKVVGWSDIDGFTVHGFLYTMSAAPIFLMSDLGPPASFFARARKISDLGRAVGVDETVADATTWFNGKYVHLPDFGHTADAFDVSRCGTIVGFAWTDDATEQRPVRWTKLSSDCRDEKQR